MFWMWFFGGEIMDDGMPFMWTCSMMHEMTTTKKISLMKGFVSFMIVALQLVQLLVVKWCHKKK
jgi:hypothetical protein